MIYIIFDNRDCEVFNDEGISTVKFERRTSKFIGGGYSNAYLNKRLLDNRDEYYNMVKNLFKIVKEDCIVGTIENLWKELNIKNKHIKQVEYLCYTGRYGLQELKERVEQDGICNNIFSNK